MRKKIIYIIFLLIYTGLFLARIADLLKNFRYIYDYYDESGIFIFIYIYPYLVIIMGIIAVFTERISSIIIASVAWIMGIAVLIYEAFFWFADIMSNYGNCTMGAMPMVSGMFCLVMPVLIVFKAVYREKGKL